MNDKNVPEGRKSIWDDMHSWMEERQREWDVEMAQLKNEFFSLKTTDNNSLTSRRTSDASLPENMSISSSSKFCDTPRGRIFRLTFDVSQFEPEEINVRTQGTSLIVHAKHEEKHEKKSVSREFNRRVDIPTHINPQNLQCFIRDDGILQVEAELPSPSYESCSISRGSPSVMENSSAQSVLSDRFSDRDISSPTKTDTEDFYGTLRTDWPFYSSSRRETDLYSSIKPDGYIGSPHGTNSDIYNWQKVNADSYDPPKSVDHQLPSRDIHSVPEFRQDVLTQRFSGLERGTENIYRGGGILDGTLSRSFRVEPGFSSDLVLERTVRNGEAEMRNGLPTENGNIVSDGLSEPDIFSVVIDVGADFEPHELAVKTVDRKLVVHARRSNNHFVHASRDDIYREFDLPKGVEPESITANLTPEGTLIIEAPTGNWPYASL